MIKKIIGLFVPVWAVLALAGQLSNQDKALCAILLCLSILHIIWFRVECILERLDK